MATYTVTQTLNGQTDSCYNFYDWFCKDATLEKRFKSLLSKVKFLVQEGIINPDKTTVWFKNNCPCYGSLYDDIRFNALDEKETYLGGFCPKSGHHNVENKCNIFLINRGINDRYEFVNWSEFKKEVKRNPELKSALVEHFYVK